MKFVFLWLSNFIAKEIRIGSFKKSLAFIFLYLYLYCAVLSCKFLTAYQSMTSSLRNLHFNKCWHYFQCTDNAQIYRKKRWGRRRSCKSLLPNPWRSFLNAHRNIFFQFTFLIEFFVGGVHDLLDYNGNKSLCRSNLYLGVSILPKYYFENDSIDARL